MALADRCGVESPALYLPVSLDLGACAGPAALRLWALLSSVSRCPDCPLPNRPALPILPGDHSESKLTRVPVCEDSCRTPRQPQV